MAEPSAQCRIPLPAVTVLRHHSAQVLGLAMHPKNATLYSSSADGALAAWELCPIISGADGLRSSVSGGLRVLACVDDGENDLLFYHAQQTGDIWYSRVSPRPRVEVRCGRSRYPEMRECVIASLGRTIAVRSEGALIVDNRCFDGGHQYLRASCGGAGLAFASKTMALYAGTGSVVRCFDVATLSVRSELGAAGAVGHYHTIQALALSHDERMLASADSSGVIVVWDLAKRRIVRDVSVRRSVSILAFSPDGRTLCAGDAGGLVSLWDTESAKVLMSFSHRSPVHALVLSPDGRYLCVDAHARLDAHDVREGLFIGTDPEAYAITVYDFGGPNLGTRAPDDLHLDRPDLWPDAPEE